MDLERVKMRAQDWWEGMGRGDNRQKFTIIAVCVLAPLALIVLIWNATKMFEAPIEISPTPEATAETREVTSDLATLAAMSQPDLEAEVKRRKAAHAEAQKAGDAAAAQLAFGALERAMEALSEMKNKAAGAGG